MSEVRKKAEMVALMVRRALDVPPAAPIPVDVDIIEHALADFADAQMDKVLNSVKAARDTRDDYKRPEARDAIAQRLREQGLHPKWADMVSALQPEHLVKK